MSTVRRDYGMRAEQENTAPDQQAVDQPKKQLRVARPFDDHRSESTSHDSRAATARENRGGKGENIKATPTTRVASCAFHHQVLTVHAVSALAKSEVRPNGFSPRPTSAFVANLAELRQDRGKNHVSGSLSTPKGIPRL